MLFILFVVYATIGDVPGELMVARTEFPLMTLEACTKAAEELAVDSIQKFPELAPYKTYQCKLGSI